MEAKNTKCKATEGAKKTTVRDLEQCAFPKDMIAEIEYNGITLHIKKLLSFVEFFDFIDGVVKSCVGFDTEHPTIRAYRPEALDFAIRYEVFTKYAQCEMPKDTSAQYSLLYRCDKLYDKIKEVISEAQFNDLMRCINSLIDYSVATDTSAVTMQNTDIQARLFGVEQQLDKLFGNISEEDMGLIVSALANTSLDEEKIVEAIMREKQAKADE